MTYDEDSHWYACADCGATKDEAEHSYENNCDTTCDCGYERVAQHSYSLTYDEDSHWYACSGCEEKKDVAEHSYDNDKDATCNTCGYEREVTETATTTLRVVSGEVKAGDSITVDVVIENNVGFMYLELTPNFPSALTLTNVTNGTLISDFTQGTQYIWVADDTVTENGTILSLTFSTTADTPEGVYSLDFTLRLCANMDEEEVELEVIAGEITVFDFVWGDVTGDGKINGMDIIRLKKYLAAYDYTTETSTVEIAKGADATGDGKINGMDIIRLKKYLAAFDYNTNSSTVKLGPSK